MYIVLLFLLVSNVFPVLFAMDDAEQFPFHAVVRNVYNGVLDAEQAKERITELYAQNSNPNNITGERTAARLSVDYCVQQPDCFENQLSTLELLLDFDKKKGLDSNKENIREFLNQECDGLKPYLDGDSSFDKERATVVLCRISRVRELVKESE